MNKNYFTLHSNIPPDYMKEVEDIISSGLLELYCFGLASSEEMEQVQTMKDKYVKVRDEIALIEATINARIVQEGIKPSDSAKERLMLSFTAAELGLPALLSQVSSIDEWLNYLEQNNIRLNPGIPYLWTELPSTPDLVSYAVWAPKGMNVEEEHDDEEERLLMLSGTCNISINGAVTEYCAGDFIVIPEKTWHKAESTSEMMVLVGQRIKLK